MKKILDYYTTQSLITHPGKYAELYADLPGDVPSLCKIVQGLILHSADGNLYNYQIPLHRLKELDNRYCENILASILALDASPLTITRPAAKRVIGICRDSSVLLCSILRHKNIPARLRVGFSIYHFPDFYHDQVLVEYWRTAEQCWGLVDARTTAELVIQRKMHISFDLTNMPVDKFISAGLAWEKSRNKQEDSKKFGTGLQHRIRGLWYIRNKLLQDIAALNKMELLLWDCWGFMLNTEAEIPPTDLAELLLLDEIACLTQASDARFAELQAAYTNHSNLKVPASIMSFSPSSGAQRVEL